MRDRIMTFGFAALAAVATAGWMRQPVQLTPADLASNFAAPQGIQPLPVTSAANTFTAPEAPVAAQAPVAVSRPRVVRQAAAAEPVYRTVAHNDQPRMRTRDERIARDSDYSYRDDRAYEGPRRSTGKSAAIIAGGAATGAAIGGMAGGGKGAAIGAIVGGIGGTIYDRATYKKTDGWGWKRDIQ